MTLAILPRVPDRGAAYAGVLQQILATQEANKQEALARQRAAEAQRAEAVKAALAPYANQPQLLTRALAALTPEDRQRAQRSGVGLVPPIESAEQELERTRFTAQTKDITGQQPPVAASPEAPPVAASPAPNEIVDAKVRQFEAIYKHAPAKEQVEQWYQAALLGQEGQVTAAKTAAKIVPTAQEAIKNAADEKIFNQVTKPNADSEIANRASQVKYRDTVQTANTRATTAHTQAGTVKINEETKALRTSNDPVVKSILARALAEGVLQDPRSFEGMPARDKELVIQVLRRKPSKLTGPEIDQIDASENGLNLLRDTRAIVDKWAKRGVAITGPVLGRYEEGANRFGDGIMPPQLSPEQKTEFAQDISKMHEWLTVLPILETKGLVGSRPAKEVIARVATVTPSLSKAADFFDGAMAGTEQRLAERLKTLAAKQWGGRPPVLDGAGTSKPLDEATARQFLQQAGGDKARARQLASAAGYTF